MDTLVEPATSAPPRRARRWRLGVLVVVALVVIVAAVATERLAHTPPEPLGPAPGAWTVVPHTGLSAWVDVYDWTVELGGPQPSVTADDVDAMADAGVQTIYIQTAHTRSASVGVMEPARLEKIIQRANDHRMHVVAWYLPTFEDVDADLQRLTASADLDVGGLAVDIESVAIPDAAERNRRLLELSTRLRAAIDPDKAIAAITPSAVQLQVVNPAFWPGFPWRQIGATYDAILPMSYWSIRKGELRDGHTYTDANLERTRASIGNPDVPIVPVGGLAEDSTVTDLQGMVTAIEAHDAPGGGLYDWASSTPEQWEVLAPLAALQQPLPDAATSSG
ncbi:MAG: hypothetical protein ACJ739_14530 [Acidimicrobiales bacterium]